MKEEVLNSKHVFTKNNQVFIKNKACLSSGKMIKVNQEVWSPINFQWIPIVEFQEKFKI